MPTQKSLATISLTALRIYVKGNAVIVGTSVVIFFFNAVHQVTDQAVNIL